MGRDVLAADLVAQGVVAIATCLMSRRFGDNEQRVVSDYYGAQVKAGRCCAVHGHVRRCRVAPSARRYPYPAGDTFGGLGACAIDRFEAANSGPRMSLQGRDMPAASPGSPPKSGP